MVILEVFKVTFFFVSKEGRKKTREPAMKLVSFFVYFKIFILDFHIANNKY